MGSFGEGGGRNVILYYFFEDPDSHYKVFLLHSRRTLMSGLSAKLFSTCQMRVRWERKDHEDTS